MNALAKIVLLAIQVMLCGVVASLAQGDESAVVKSDSEKYETQINLIIRTRLDEEKEYVHSVIELVRQGRLPRKLVDKSIFWVRNHCADDDHCFVYFEQVLRRQAERLKFEVPAFDYDVYDVSNR